MKAHVFLKVLNLKERWRPAFVGVSDQRSRRGGRAAVTVLGSELEDTLMAGRGGVVEEDMARVGRRKGEGNWVRGCFGMANRGLEIVNLVAWRRHDKGRGIVDLMYQNIRQQRCDLGG
jgi:hypothetical protein